jgi:ABC-type dipeptide/oligopeptide/nickel transport system ATPase component
VEADLEQHEVADLDELGLAQVLPDRREVRVGNSPQVLRRQLDVAEERLFLVGERAALGVVLDALVEQLLVESLPLRRSGPDVASIAAMGHPRQQDADDLLGPVTDVAVIERVRPRLVVDQRQLGVVAHDREVPRVGRAVLEGPQFHPGRTGRNHLRVLASAAGLATRRVDEVLRLVELDGAGGRRVKGYSLGMRQRLSLAGALLGDPRGLVLDEPANGLDPQGIRWLRDFLRARAAEGRTVLISSHVLAEVAQTVDEVVVVSRGRLIAQGMLDEFGPDRVDEAVVTATR